MFSKNDDVVPVFHAEKYRNKFKNANIIIYDHIKGHFQISEFPEIVKMIKEDVKNITLADPEHPLSKKYAKKKITI